MHRAAGFVLAGLVVAAVLAAGPGAAQSEDSTLTIAWASEDHSEAILTLSATPNGLQGYTLELAVNESSDARIASVDQVTELGPLEDITIADDNRSARAKVADTSDLIGADSTDIDLVSVTFEDAPETDAPPVRITGTELTDDDGEAMPVTVRYSGNTSDVETLTDRPGSSEESGPAPGALAVLVGLVVTTLALARRN
ncbi:MAG: hypothetical protein ACOCYZ_05770 [Halococcoides sp.]